MKNIKVGVKVELMANPALCITIVQVLLICGITYKVLCNVSYVSCVMYFIANKLGRK